VEKDKKEQYKYISFFSAAILCTAVFAILGHFFSFYYDLNDDVLIKDILSGAYTGTPEAHNMQILYPLSWILKSLYSINAQTDWFGLMELGLMWLCCVLMISRTQYIIMCHIEKKTMKAIAVICMYICVIVFAFGTNMWELVIIQYTVVSGMLATTAAYLLFTKEDFEVNENILPVFLLVISFNLRSEMFLLLCPFLGVVGLCKWLSDGIDLKTCKKYVTYLLIIALFVGASYAIDSFAYRSNEWKNFKKAFDARTTLYDFTGIPDYESNKEFYESQDADVFVYDRLSDYNYVLSYRVEPVFLEKLAEYALEHNTRQKSVPYSVFEVIKNLASWRTPAERRALTSQESASYEEGVKLHVPNNVCVIILYVLAVIAAIYARDIRWAYTLPILLVMRTICWGYITYRGRINARIAHPLYFMEIVILVGVLLVAWAESDYSSVRVRKYTSALLMSAFIGSNIINALYIQDNISDIKEKSANREKYNVEANALYAYTAQNAREYYLVDVYSTVNYTEKIFDRKTAGKGNLQLAGGWMALSPLDEAKQSHYNYEEFKFITSNKMAELEAVDEIKTADGKTLFYVYRMSDIKK